MIKMTITYWDEGYFTVTREDVVSFEVKDGFSFKSIVPEAVGRIPQRLTVFTKDGVTCYGDVEKFLVEFHKETENKQI